ncbi:tropinone reductase homolog At2g29260, chloroplastic-like [Vicia villosa]|uniref:tropinone reductase homolog At2g29260, chloroplastic-like n=1 Tax=Vicia villosa TaxID=3911 RepID=UPI00273C8FD8|nr:tropinone reductase homolog At2g29260, chloroplastic-like [Vicia villosa]
MRDQSMQSSALPLNGTLQVNGRIGPLGLVGRKVAVYKLVSIYRRYHRFVTCTCSVNDINKYLKEWSHLSFHVTDSICNMSVPQQREILMEDVFSAFPGKLNILENNIQFPSHSFISTLLYYLAFSAIKYERKNTPLSWEGSQDPCGVVFISSVTGFAQVKSMFVQGATKVIYITIFGKVMLMSY